jgi:hypothetical protein
VTDAWNDEGFGAENDWGEESIEADLEEDEVLDDPEVDQEALDDELVDEDEQ